VLSDDRTADGVQHESRSGTVDQPSQSTSGTSGTADQPSLMFCLNVLWQRHSDGNY